MGARSEMERVGRVIDALKKASSKHKSDTIQTAIGELNSILSLLNLSFPSTKTLTRLTSIFRDNLAALYAEFPVLMLQFCAVVLRAIFCEKIKAAFAAGEFTHQYAWETVQKSVVSSALDFLDSDETSMFNKAAAGAALSSTLCEMFYPVGPLFQWRSPSLVFNVNLLLTEIAAHPENQSQFRTDKVLGAARMASALAQSKDFLVVDSLLALVGKILPPRATDAKRTDFVNAVFTPALFPCSSKIKSLIAGSSTTVWDPVVVQILNYCLAPSNISYPQPFYISGLRTSTPLPNIVDPLYVDHKGLFANTEKDGVFETYQVPFTSIERIKLGAAGAGHTPVLLHLAAAPLVGAASEADTPADQRQRGTMAFLLKTADTAQFVAALKARGHGDKLVSEADRKVSKNAEGLSLEFDSSARKPATQQEKVAKVEQLWQSTGDAGLGEPTSPLVAQTQRDSSDSRHSASSQHDTIYGEDLSDVSDGEKTDADAKPRKSSASASSRPRVRIVLDSDEEDADAAAVQQQPRTARPRKSAMKKPAAVSASAAEEEEEAEIDDSQSPPSTNAMDQDFEPTQTLQEPAADVPVRLTRGAAAKNLAIVTSADEPGKNKTATGRAKASATAVDVPPPVRSIRRSANAKKAPPIDDQLSEDEIDTTANSKPSAKAQDTSADDSRPEKRANRKRDTKPTPKNKTEIVSKAFDEKSRRKRAKANDDQKVLDEDEDASDHRPTKRLRGADAAPEEDLPPAAPPRRASAVVFGDRSVNPAPAKRHYGGKKGRPSSPLVSDAGDIEMAVDYDELPAAPSPPPVLEKAPKAAKQEAAVDTRKSRVAAMKGKAGQKPPPKAPPKSGKAAPPEKHKTKTQTAVAKEEKENHVEENDEMESESEAKPSRRTTRSAKDNAVPKPAQPIVQITVPKPKAKPQKPKKAPWEDMHLKKNDAISSDDPPAAVYVKEDDAVATPDELPVESDSIEESYVPLKGSPPSDRPRPSDPPPILQDDVTMIDLTQDASPKAKTLNPDPLTVPVKMLIPHPVDLTSPSPKFKTTRALESKSATVTLEIPKVVDTTTPIRAQARSSPVIECEPALPLPMTKFKSEVPARPIQPTSVLQKLSTPSPARPSKLPTLAPVQQPTPPRPVRTKKAPTPLRRSPLASTPPRQSRAQSPSAPRPITIDSPFPERVYQTVAFAPSRASSPSVRRTNAQFIPTRTAKNHAYERTPDLGRPARANLDRAPHKREGGERDDYKRGRSPMQGILEILNEIQEVVVEKLTQRFDNVRNDVRLGRDGILRGAAANLETMRTESESHFNTLVDLEEEYAGYHRKIMLGMDDLHKSTEVMAIALGQVVQHHDRRTLSKKLPTTLFTIPSIVRNPVLSL
ncbi:hypothetical protein DFH09DRAFT_1358779 [Mycena vulgaris]|nr:hypothetical protein DFH09DRAFT_1358779 [Mycena vulgaris]